MKKELLKKLQKREFGNIWSVGSDYNTFKIYINDGSIEYITEQDFLKILEYDENLFDYMNRMLQN